MASNSTPTTTPYMPDHPTAPTTPNTTFVQADPSNFRAVVQKLTGASDDPSAHKLPLTHPSRPTTTTATKKPLFKLHERRKNKLEHLTIASASSSLSPSLSDKTIMMLNMNMMNVNVVSPSSSSSSSSYVRKMVVVAASSPVSPLDAAAARGSPRSPHEEEEERVIAEKGFYLRPIISPLATPRGSEPPELLPLFPLHSPSSRSSEQP